MTATFMAGIEPNRHFIDTGAFIALTDRSEQHHQVAAAYLPLLLESLVPLLTTNLVLAETYNWLLRRLGVTSSKQFASGLRSNSLISVIEVIPEHEVAAWSVIEKYRDQDLSFTDATSFVVMKHYGIKDAFAFDHHFRLAGFSIHP